MKNLISAYGWWFSRGAVFLATTSFVVASVFAQVPPSGASVGASLKRSRGAVPPPNLIGIVDVQQRASTVALHYLALNGVKALPGVKCSPTQAKFDWSQLKKVTAVQDQSTCGDCWAFAAIGAYEASYLIQSGVVAPPAPPGSGASEQQALDCSFSTYDCSGGWHDKVFDYFVQPGEITRNEYPYSRPPIKAACKSPIPPSSYAAVTWGFVKGATIPSDAELKAAICKYGPIVAAVSAEGWDDSADNLSYDYSSKNPKWKELFPDGVYRKGKASNPGLTMANLQPGDIDHDILIVGWDDTLGSWLIKNSWGTDWGDQGFMRLAYGTANVGFNAAWIIARPKSSSVNGKKLSDSVIEDLKSLHEAYRFMRTQ